jgi:hypothetical protein
MPGKSPRWPTSLPPSLPPSLPVPQALGELLRLAIPSTFVWLITFYVYFHCTLNLFAEITRFGDRLFFKDWWNCTSFSRYW